MIIVFDTNVLIAALIVRGVCGDLVEHCGLKHNLVTSEFILNELREHLACKFNYDSRDIEKAVNLLRSRMEVVIPVELETAVCRDPDDDKILGTAIAGNASCIVTGDKDLLVIKQYRMIDIIGPSEFAKYEA